MFSAWCVLGLNLVATGNLPLIHQLDPFVTETWTNFEAIAVNQDAVAWTAARPGKRLDNGPALASGQQDNYGGVERLYSSGSYVRAHVVMSSSLWPSHTLSSRFRFSLLDSVGDCRIRIVLLCKARIVSQFASNKQSAAVAHRS